MDGQQASTHNLPVLYTYPLIAPNKPVYTEPLSVTVPVVFGTCKVLVRKVVSIPVLQQNINFYTKMSVNNHGVCYIVL